MADAARLVEALKQRSMTIATAESLTAGLMAATIASVPGASAVLMGGVVAYDERIKQKLLSVRAETLQTHGVYSPECAMEMAQGAKDALKVDITLSCTGIAGPDGGTPETPVGTVFIAISSERGTTSQTFHFTGDRQSIRTRTVEAALALALETVEAEG